MGIRYFLGKDVLQNYKKAFDKLFVNSIFHADADAFMFWVSCFLMA